MNARPIIVLMLMLLLGASAPAFAACTYVPKINVTDISLSSLFIVPGDTLTVVLDVESTEVYAGDVEAVLKKSGFEFPIYTGQHYIIPGQNEVRFSGRVGAMVGPGVYTLKVRIGGLELSQDVILEGEPADAATLPYIMEDQKRVAVHLPSTEQVVFTVAVTDAAGKQERYMRTVKPQDGEVVLEVPVCQNCRIDVTSAYGGGVHVWREYGAYSRPYLRITELTPQKIVLEGCAPTEYTIYLDGREYGLAQGISRIEKALVTGYENVRVTMKGANWEFERVVGLANFAYPVTESVRVTKQQPFTINIIARDALGRRAPSSGVLYIEGAGFAYAEEIMFTGEYERELNLKEGRYTVRYNGKEAAGESVPVEYEMPEPEPVREEFVLRDIVPALIVILVAALAVLVLIWVKRMRVR
ncbi:MAG: hypothetical protein QXU54_02165 [Candidatus Micrarchaeia archaeon]